MTEQKTCTKCGMTKPATRDFFMRRTQSPSGLEAHCLECRRAYEVARQRANPKRSHHGPNEETKRDRRQRRIDAGLPPYSDAEIEYKRRYRQAHPYVYTGELRARNRAFVNDEKMRRGCSECGYRGHPAALDLHHRDPGTKTTDISDIIGSAGIAKIRAEMAKCDVLCANCHRTLHAQAQAHSES
jgi:hypothetical protein